MTPRFDPAPVVTDDHTYDLETVTGLDGETVTVGVDHATVTVRGSARLGPEAAERFGWLFAHATMLAAQCKASEGSGSGG